jgi:hypothetical protein
VLFGAFLVFLLIHSSVFILFFKKQFFSELCAIPILFLQSANSADQSVCPLLAFRWHTVEISTKLDKIVTNVVKT